MRRQKGENPKANAAVTRKVRAVVPRLLDWFGRNARDLPWRKTRDPYAIWVSEIMLQQTQVKTVVPYWNRWMRELPTIRKLAEATPARLHKLWEGLGYYSRVRNLQKAATVIEQKHGGTLPESFDEILALPGIGRYTAGAICSIAFDQPKPVLDGNVMRVLCRLFAIETDPREAKTNARLWHLAGELVSHAAWLDSRNMPSARQSKGRSPKSGVRSASGGAACSHLNQSLMELGAVVCTPRNPGCDRCPMAQQCAARRGGRAEELPVSRQRPSVTNRRVAAFVVERGGRFLVQQRPEGGVNAHLWEFPNAEALVGGGDATAAAAAVLGARPAKLQHLCTVKHAITRHQITLDAYAVSLRSTLPPMVSGARWVTSRQLSALAFAGAHRKIIAALRGRRGLRFGGTGLDFPLSIQRKNNKPEPIL